MNTANKILITGSAGFLGSALFKYLKSNGYDVTGIDATPSNDGTVDFLHDVLGIEQINDNFDVVFHFAAFVGGRLNIENKYFGISKNNEIDRKVFEYCVNRGIQHLIYPSSSAVYPVDMQTKYINVSLKEEMVDFSTNTFGMPDHMYGWNKLTAERTLYQLRRDNKIPYISILRPFSVYGPAQTEEYPFNALIKRIRETDPSNIVTTVWGDGYHSRDFVYIDDAIHVFNHLIKNPKPFTVLNISTGIPTTFIELMNMMSTVIHGRRMDKIIPMIEKPMGVYSRYGSIDKMKSLGLVPKVDIYTGIEKVVKHNH